MTVKRSPAAKRTPKSQPPRFAGLRQWLTVERAIIGGTILFTVVILVALIISTSNTGTNRNRVVEGVEEFPNPGAGHQTTPVVYAQTPPIGGAHHPVWQNCGVYTDPLIDEHAVHSLEHGAVWITYQPDLPEDQVRRLQDVTRQGSYRILSPYPGIDSPIILSAWGVQLRVDDASDSRINDFILKYEQGPQTPEVGATCVSNFTDTAVSAAQ